MTGVFIRRGQVDTGKGGVRHRLRAVAGSWDQESEEARKVMLETSEGASPAHTVIQTSGLLT